MRGRNLYGPREVWKIVRRLGATFDLKVAPRDSQNPIQLEQFGNYLVWDGSSKAFGIICFLFSVNCLCLCFGLCFCVPFGFCTRLHSFCHELYLPLLLLLWFCFCSAGYIHGGNHCGQPRKQKEIQKQVVWKGAAMTCRRHLQYIHRTPAGGAGRAEIFR